MRLLVFVLTLCVFLHVCWSHDEDDDHDYEHEEANCPITASFFASMYLMNVETMGIVDPRNGQPCSVPSEESSQYELGDDFDEYDICDTLFQFSQRLILDLNATDECCLYNTSQCHNGTDTPAQGVDKAKAFGYGTLMVVVLSLLSLIGVFVLPLLKSNSKVGRYYQHFNLFMISLGAAALFSDAVMHIIPHALGVDDHHGSDDNGGHTHSNQDDDQDHSHGDSGYGDLMVVWRTCAIMGGMYFFYMMEYILRWLTGADGHNKAVETNDPAQPLIKDKKVSSFDRIFNNSSQFPKSAIYKGRCCMTPLAVLIVCGDAIHNFTDGIALGASISESLALGISTAIAVTFHEIPHELGNFAILLSTGMKWQYVLLVNFCSTLTAFVGFYIGVGVGLMSAEANSWLLAVAAGTFLYVALVDLLPLIMSSEVKGCTGFFLSNLGFFISFSILLLVAVFEEKMDSVFTEHFS